MQRDTERRCDAAWMGALAAVALALLAAAPVARAGGSNDPASESQATDRIIVKYRSGLPGIAASAAPAERAFLHRNVQAVAARAGLAVQLVRVGALDAHVMRLDRLLSNARVRELTEEIVASDPGVEYAEPDRILKAQFTPNDVQYGQQWSYFDATGGINLPAAWDKSTGAGVVVGVIDTGYRPHADLAANVLPGYDFIADTFVANDGNGRESDARDPGDWAWAGQCDTGSPAQDQASSWHGTHVAGTVAAVSNNSSGVAGVAFNAKVLPARVLGKCGGYTSDVAAGIIWAAGGSVTGVPANPTPAKVINLSLGGSGACDITSQNAINTARSRGAVVVAAAGNSNADASNFSPANCTGVISVAAVNRAGGRAYYSNFGAGVAIAAPGGDMRSSAANGILSTLNNGTSTPGADAFAYYQGTSMAAPHVSGVVALMLSKNPALTPDEVAARLKSSARPFPASCVQCGSGIVNASAAVDAAGGTGPAASPNNEVEPNNTAGVAQSVKLGITINGTMSSASDTDFFRVTVPNRTSMSVTLTPNSTSNYDLYVYAGNGQLLATSTKGTGLVDAASVTNASSAGTVYYVQVRFYSGGTGSTGGSYKLLIK